MPSAGDRMAIARFDFFNPVLIIDVGNYFSFALVGKREHDHWAAIDRFFSNHRIVGERSAYPSVR
jgi:hypothetical protein